MSKNKNDLSEEDLDDLLDAQWEKQDKIHKKCKMKEKDKNRSY